MKSKAALLLIVSPTCSAFGEFQAFSLKRLGEARVKQMLEMGIKRLNFAMGLCEIQRRSGLYFLSEHPAGASSWSVSAVQRMVKRPGLNACEGECAGST